MRSILRAIWDRGSRMRSCRFLARAAAIGDMRGCRCLGPLRGDWPRRAWRGCFCESEITLVHRFAGDPLDFFAGVGGDEISYQLASERQIGHMVLQQIAQIVPVPG